MPQIELPYPPAALFPNALARHSGQWPYREKARKLRQLAWGLTAVEIGGKLRNWPASEIVLKTEITPPMRKGKVADEDGIMSALKAARDGIADALGVDDRHFRNERPTWREREGDGKIVISF